MKKTCPRCGKRVGHGAARCRGCGYRFPERSGPKPAGLGMGVGFPLATTGVLLLFIGGTSSAFRAAAAGMILVGVLLFFDPR
jgi:hypothetical protein